MSCALLLAEVGGGAGVHCRIRRHHSGGRSRIAIIFHLVCIPDVVIGSLIRLKELISSCMDGLRSKRFLLHNGPVAMPAELGPPSTCPTCASASPSQMLRIASSAHSLAIGASWSDWQWDRMLGSWPDARTCLWTGPRLNRALARPAGLGAGRSVCMLCIHVSTRSSEA